MTPRLQISDLTTTFRGHSPIRAVRGVSLSVDAGETLVLLGESGSGKSVTARSVLRLYGSAAACTGSVTLDGEDLLTMPEKRMRTLRGRRLGLVPQDPTAALDPLRSIGSQLAEVLRAHRLTRTRAGTRARCEELLTLVGIPDVPQVLASRPHQLSGGMRQRAVIAIAVAGEPDVLIADEPTTALDVTVQAQVLSLFTSLQRRMGMALLMVTHDVGVAEELDGMVAVMYAGRIAESGSARDILTHPQHPYTAGLLSSLPTPGVPRGRLPVIVGRPPLTGEHSAGCAFAPRCDHAVHSCRHVEPELVDTGGRWTACPVVAPVNGERERQPA
ncbi:ABC transporter ATP-binding protein [Tsukamurella sp. 8F]|uniref:ABC transporter ATP-binding protein n=1 Tax=unclassified Tsukamurella TaxID=2633480 RepID=UPI0023B9F849|nr:MULTISPECIES: ABC transporter ATP-binding protein [unclassified Tsukamurella]MDF0528965.1 ABC transporter ATP-binding protein [Tsukamurella sp. 8J]MDF0587338.1 ABC transporter ATP-binding protein [Tsukamurella sp. 8F]